MHRRMFLVILSTLPMMGFLAPPKPNAAEHSRVHRLRLSDDTCSRSEQTPS